MQKNCHCVLDFFGEGPVPSGFLPFFKKKRNKCFFALLGRGR